MQSVISGNKEPEEGPDEMLLYTTEDLESSDQGNYRNISNVMAWDLFKIMDSEMISDILKSPNCELGAVGFNT